MAMTFFGLLPLVLLLISLFFFTYVYAQHSKHPVNRSYLLYTLCIAAFLFKDFLMWSPFVELAPDFIVRYGSITWLPLGFLFLNFSYRLLRRKEDFFYYITLVATVVIIFISLTTDFIVNSYVSFYWGYQSSEGLFTGLATIITIIIPSIVAFILLLQRYLSSTSVKFRNS
jgi:hypothetical protein